LKKKYNYQEEERKDFNIEKENNNLINQFGQRDSIQLCKSNKICDQLSYYKKENDENTKQLKEYSKLNDNQRKHINSPIKFSVAKIEIKNSDITAEVRKPLVVTENMMKVREDNTSFPVTIKQTDPIEINDQLVCKESTLNQSSHINSNNLQSNVEIKQAKQLFVVNIPLSPTQNRKVIEPKTKNLQINQLDKEKQSENVSDKNKISITKPLDVDNNSLKEDIISEISEDVTLKQENHKCDAHKKKNINKHIECELQEESKEKTLNVSNMPVNKNSHTMLGQLGPSMFDNISKDKLKKGIVPKRNETVKISPKQPLENSTISDSNSVFNSETTISETRIYSPKNNRKQFDRNFNMSPEPFYSSTNKSPKEKGESSSLSYSDLNDNNNGSLLFATRNSLSTIIDQSISPQITISKRYFPTASFLPTSITSITSSSVLSKSESYLSSSSSSSTTSSQSTPSQDKTRGVSVVTTTVITEVSPRQSPQKEVSQQDKEVSQQKKELPQLEKEVSQKEKEKSQHEKEVSQQEKEISQQEKEISQQEKEARREERKKIVIETLLKDRASKIK